MNLKSEFLVHVIPGISDYTKTKTKVQPRVGLPGDSIAELTLQLWYEKLCSLGCLGIEERRDHSNYVYEEFQRELGHGSGGFFETNLIWKDNNPLKTTNLTALIDQVASWKIYEEFYLPHRPAVRESVERIKVKITYDASSKPAKYAASLNDCLEKVLLFKIQCG